MQPLTRSLSIQPGAVTLAQLRDIYSDQRPFELAASCWQKIAASHRAVAEIVASGVAVYGINTGFGLLAQTRIADHQLALLQRNLVLSHSAGVGAPMDPAVVKLMIFLKVASLCHGHSGVRAEVIEALINIYHQDIVPCIPSKGSVGASGDLAPLAHLAAALLGVGDVWLRGQLMPAAEALKCSLEVLELGPKEGLALLNGTQASTALALAGLFKAENGLAAAVAVGALAVDAMKGSTVPFDPRIHALRGQPGQIAVATKYADFLHGSQILKSHVDCGKVKTPIHCAVSRR